MMNKFIAYYRVSTDKQGQSGLGLEAQRTICYAYARSINAEIISEYTDIESGSHNDRPELLKALALLEIENGSRLLVAKQCRLTRSVALMSSLLEKKVPLTIAETPEASIFELHIRAVLNEETRRQISINTRNALMAAKARGVKLGKLTVVNPVQSRKQSLPAVVKPEKSTWINQLRALSPNEQRMHLGLERIDNPLFDEPWITM